MNPESVIAGASAALSVVAGVYSARANRRALQLEHDLADRRKRQDAAAQAERVLHQYRQPLLDAAHALQGRFFNIVAQDFLGVYYVRQTDEDERTYARDYTVYVVAEYLCWAEILRREARFQDLGDVATHQALMAQLTTIQFAFQDDKGMPGQFRVFRGRQRALAELMMVPTEASEGPRCECMGYAAFCRRLADDAEFAAWFARLRTDVDTAAGSSTGDNMRLVRIQHELIALIDLLDPGRVRVPPQFRRRLDVSAPLSVHPSPSVS